MKIKGDGFILRPIKMSDAQAYWETMQDEETIKGFMSVPHSFSEAKEEVKEHIKKSKTKITEVFTIEVDGKYAGNVKLDCQGYKLDTDEGRVHLWVHPDFRGRGLAIKALALLVDYGFNKRKFRVIYAQTKAENKAVAKVLENVGFRFVEYRLVEGIKKMWWEKRKK